MSEELRRRVIAGLEVELALFGSCSTTASVLRLPGVVASVSPATPDRSLFNSVTATGPDALAAAIDGLTDAYAKAGVRAWTVWVPDDDRRSAALLAARGHVLDGSPRSMALELTDLRPVAIPEEAELVPAEIGDIARINDRAYGLEGAAWAATIEHRPDLDMEAAVALVDGEPVSCAVVLDREDDACVTAVATAPEHRGKGLAGGLISELLGSARRRGLRTGSLQASKAGAPVYERIGFEDVGFIEMWELREA